MPRPFGDRLLALRKRCRLTQVEVAKILGCSPPRISEWERGARTPKPLTQEGILARLEKKRKRKKK